MHECSGGAGRTAREVTAAGHPFAAGDRVAVPGGADPGAWGRIAGFRQSDHPGARGDSARMAMVAMTDGTVSSHYVRDLVERNPGRAGPGTDAAAAPRPPAGGAGGRRDLAGEAMMAVNLAVGDRPTHATPGTRPCACGTRWRRCGIGRPPGAWTR